MHKNISDPFSLDFYENSKQNKPPNITGKIMKKILFFFTLKAGRAKDRERKLGSLSKYTELNHGESELKSVNLKDTMYTLKSRGQ